MHPRRDILKSVAALDAWLLPQRLIKITTLGV